ncbi:hypothetical protein THAOC_31641, partial [Thalassiosira oceanica]
GGEEGDGGDGGSASPKDEDEDEDELGSAGEGVDRRDFQSSYATSPITSGGAPSAGGLHPGPGVLGTRHRQQSESGGRAAQSAGGKTTRGTGRRRINVERHSFFHEAPRAGIDAGGVTGRCGLPAAGRVRRTSGAVRRRRVPEFVD